VKKLVLNIFSIIFLALISGCQYDPFAGDMTTEQPKKEDVIGVYKFEEQTIAAIPIDKLGQEATIVLKSDGHYEANNIPNVFGGADAQTRKHISAKGIWKIETIGEVGSGWGGRPKLEWGITLTAIDTNLSNIGLTGEKAPYGLMVTFSDPDLGAVMKFKRIP
jgi:hypothetical protein